MSASRRRVVESLISRGVQPPTAEAVGASAVLDGAVGLLLYGSHARGDHSPASDVDLLVVAGRPGGSVQIETASVSIYTTAQLSDLSGTLFGLHLSRDGVVLQDTGGVVSQILSSVVAPVPLVLFQRIRHLAAVLDGDPLEYTEGRTRIARYLLRTAVYVEALDDGEPCFSVRDLARRADEPGLEEMLASRFDSSHQPTADEFVQVRERLIETVGTLEQNPHGSLRNLVVAEWWDDRDRATFGVLVLKRAGASLDYTALEKVTL